MRIIPSQETPTVTHNVKITVIFSHQLLLPLSENSQLDIPAQPFLHIIGVRESVHIIPISPATDLVQIVYGICLPLTSPTFCTEQINLA